jgi:predicted AAA+ superfamily ATPase
MKWQYRSRWIAERIRQAVSFSPVVVLTGARQTGKSTLLRYEPPFSDWRLLNMDDMDILSMSQNRPEELLAVSENLIIDEVQRSPDLLLSVKAAVDENRERRFILSGSANLLLMKAVSESLAGRALYFDLLPFSCGEEKERSFPDWIIKLPENDPPSFTASASLSPSTLFRGSLPPVTFLSTQAHIRDWWQGYIRTYLERDLRDISQVTNLPDFRKAMGLLAVRNGQILKQSELARDSGLSQATAGRYINLMEVSGLVFKLKPYSKNISKRLIKSPKLYFADTGLACALAGIKDSKQISTALEAALFESYIFLNLLAISSVAGGELYYFRTQGGKEKEVDFILEVEGKIIAIEVKSSTKVSFRDAENVLFLKDLLPNWGAGLIVYRGTEVLSLGKNIYAVPWYLI